MIYLHGIILLSVKNRWTVDKLKQTLLPSNFYTRSKRMHFTLYEILEYIHFKNWKRLLTVKGQAPKRLCNVTELLHDDSSVVVMQLNRFAKAH